VPLQRRTYLDRIGRIGGLDRAEPVGQAANLGGGITADLVEICLRRVKPPAICDGVRSRSWLRRRRTSAFVPI
jgi:hypothetical protein